MTDERVYPPPFANDDPLRKALAFNEEFWRVQDLAKTDPEAAEIELQRLLLIVRREKAERER